MANSSYGGYPRYIHTGDRQAVLRQRHIIAS